MPPMRRRRNIPDDAFQQELKRRAAAAEMREGLRRHLLAEKVIEREIGPNIAITDWQVTDFFNANRSQFNVPEEAYDVAEISSVSACEPGPAGDANCDKMTPRHRRCARAEDADDGPPERRRIVRGARGELFRGAGARRPAAATWGSIPAPPQTGAGGTPPGGAQQDARHDQTS